jgi:hypothetical protein
MQKRLWTNKLQEDIFGDNGFDEENLTTFLYNIFRSRQKFVFDLSERMFLYFGYLLPFFRCLGCRDQDRIKKRVKLFNRAKDRYESDLDVLRIMQTVKMSENFLKSFLYHEDKLLLKFDSSNVI